MAYEPITLVGFTTSVLAIISCVFTLITLSREWRRRTEFARDVIDVHRREIGVLGHILEDSRSTISATAAVPEAVLEALRMCEQRQAGLQKLLTLSALEQGNSSNWLSINLRLPLLEKDLKRRYKMFRDDILLLRTLCSEYVTVYETARRVMFRSIDSYCRLRSERQHLELTRDITRLVLDYIGDIEQRTPGTPSTISQGTSGSEFVLPALDLRMRQD